MNRKKHKNRISFVVLFTVCFTLMISIIGCSKQEKTKETTATSTPTDISKETETPTPKTTHPPKVASDNKETITPTISAVPDATTELTPTVEIAADSIESATPAAPMNDYDKIKDPIDIETSAFRMTLPGTWKSNYTLVDNGDSWALCFAEPSSSGDHVEILIIDTCSNEEEANEISGMLDNSRIMGGGNSEYWGFVVGTPTDAYDSSTYTEEQLNKLQQMRGDVNDVLGTFMSK